MVSLIENASVTERSAIKGLAHFRVSHRRHHLADDGSAPRLVVSGKSVRGVPTAASRRHIFGPCAKLWFHP